MLRSRKAMAVAQHNERLSAEIFEGKRLGGGARMIDAASQRRAAPCEEETAPGLCDVAGEQESQHRSTGPGDPRPGSMSFLQRCAASRRDNSSQKSRRNGGSNRARRLEWRLRRRCRERPRIFIGHAESRHLHLGKNRASVRKESATGLSKADATTRRSKSFAPRSSSSFKICCESEGWAIWQRSAARLKLPVSAMAQTYRSW